MLNYFQIKIILPVVFLILFFGLVKNSEAAEIPASSIAELNAAISSADPGDTIILANGTYTDADINFIANGTEENRITLRAQTPGGVIFTGRTYNTNNVLIMGDYLTLSGFYFKDVSGNGVLLEVINAEYWRITNCKFEHISKMGGVAEVKGLNQSYTQYLGPSRYGRLDHCTFDGNTGIEIENFIVDEQRYPSADLGNTDNQYDHNIFRNHATATADTAFQIGRGSALWADGKRGYISENATDARIIIEYNLLDHYDGSSEIVMIKSSSNIVRYNVLNNCDGAINLRGGNNSLVEGNFTYWNRGTTNFFKGVGVQGSGHIIKNNYLEGEGAGIVLKYGDGLNFHAKADKALVINNTIHNSNRGYVFMAPPTTDLPPTSISFINNLGESNVYNNALFGLNYAGTGHAWVSNRGHVSSGTLRHASIPADGVTDSGQFELTKQRTGLLLNWYGPAENKFASGSYNANIADDIEGQSRNNPPSIGCDEPGGTALRPMISPADIGTDWGKSDAVPPATPQGLTIQ